MEEKKKITPVVKGEKRRVGVGEKIARTFMKGDNLNEVGTYVVHDIIIPTIVDTIVDVIQKGTLRIFYGDDRGYTRTGSTRRTNTNYSRISSLGNGRRDDRRDISRPRNYNKVYRGYESIFLERRGDAEEVVDQLVLLTQDYGSVSVADLYEIVAMPSNYTDNKWGWYESDIARAQIRRVRGGYTVDLPDPEPLDD